MKRIFILIALLFPASAWALNPGHSSIGGGGRTGETGPAGPAGSAAAADNMGSHTATQTVDLANNGIVRGSTASFFALIASAPVIVNGTELASSSNTIPLHASTTTKTGGLLISGDVTSTNGVFNDRTKTSTMIAWADVIVDSKSLNSGILRPGFIFGDAVAGGEGIASKKTAGGDQFGVQFYVNNSSAMSIQNDKDIFMAAQLTVSGAIKGEHANGIMADFGSANSGTPDYGLRFGDVTSGEAIGSKKTAGGDQYGIQFYVNNSSAVSIQNPSGQVSFSTIPFFGGGTQSTGGNTPALGTNYPGLNLSAPYIWIQIRTRDGVVGRIPVWP